MQTVNIHDAKTHLSKLIEQALAGEEIVIAKAGKPLVRLQVLEEAKPARQLGTARHVLKAMADDFDAPLDDFADYQ